MQQYFTTKHIPTTISSKGQVTIPAEVRRHLGVETNDKINFVITPQGHVHLDVPKYKRIADLAGAAGKLLQPLSWKEMQQIAHEEHAEEVIQEGK